MNLAACDVSELQFAVELLKLTPINKSEAMAPINLSLALSIIQLGVTGETKKKLTEVLFGGDIEHFIEHQKQLLHTLENNKKGVVMEIHNQLFVSDRVTIKNDYKDQLKENFNADIKKLNIDKTSECVKIIADFIDKATKGKIVSAIEESAIQGSIALMVSVFYAKANWYQPFKVKATRMRKFVKGNGETSKILFMAEAEDNFYYEDKEVKVVSKMYKDKELQFTWILPHDHSVEGFAKFRGQLSGKKIEHYLSQMEREMVSMQVPKMDLKCQYDLMTILKHLDLSSLTTAGADFSGITDDKFMFGTGQHSTMLQVDEFGTTAAAVTYNAWEGDNGKEPKYFGAKHPFIFMMHKNKHPAIIGQFHGPQ